MPPAAAPAVVTPHNFRAVTLPGMDDTLDYVSTPKIAGVVKAFPDLGWVDSSSVHAGEVAAPRLSICGMICLPMHYPDWTHPIAVMSLAMSDLTIHPASDYMSRCADTLEDMGLFSVALYHYNDWTAKLIPALAHAPTPSPFALGAGDLLERYTFITPAVAAVPGRAAIPAVAARAAVAARGGRRAVAARAAVPAVPAVAAISASPPSSPAELLWWSMVKLSHGVDMGSPLPFESFLRRGMAAPDRASRIARDDSTSRVHALSSIFFRHLCAIANNATATPAEVARAFRRFHDRLHTLPPELRSGSFDPDVLETEAADDFAYSQSVTQQNTVTTGRLPHVKRAYESLYDYAMRLTSSSARRATLEALVPLLAVSGAAKLTLFAQLAPLDKYLASRSSLLVQAFNKGIPVEGTQGVNALLIQEHDEWKASGEAVGSSSAREEDADGTLMSRGGKLSEPALRRALIEDKDFVKSAEQIAALDLDKEDDRREAIEIAALADCAVYQRFFAYPKDLLNRHPVFNSLHKCMEQARSYIGHAQAADKVTGVIPKLQKHWMPSMHFVQQLFQGRVTKLGLCNGPDGAIALFNLTSAEPFEPVPEDQMYIVPSVLELVGAYASASFTAAGWSATSTTGYTIGSYFERQHKHVKWIQGMGEMEQATMMPGAQVAFKAGLQDIETHIDNLLSDPEQASVNYDCVLPFGGAYDALIAKQVEGAEPVVIVRQAFPGLLPASTPRSLPGVVLPSSGRGGGGGGGGDGGGRGGGGGGGKATDGPLKPTTTPDHKKPGGLADFPKWPDDAHVIMGKYKYDVPAVCDYYKIDRSKWCPQVGLSSKQGGDKLALCPHWKEPGHTSLTSSAHVVPSSFNMKYIEKHFAEEVKHANKGKKRKST